MTKKPLAYALTDRKTGKVCWIGLIKPRKDYSRWWAKNAKYRFALESAVAWSEDCKLSRIKISTVK